MATEKVPEATAGPVPDLPGFGLRPGVTFPDWSLVPEGAARQALEAMLASDNLLSRWGRRSPDADRAHVALLQLYAASGCAPDAGAIAVRAGLPEASIPALLEERAAHDLIVLREGTILGAYPFTDRATGHEVVLGECKVNAMCAVDALGIGAMTGQDVVITSYCRHCHAQVRIETGDTGRALRAVTPPAAVMWQSVDYDSACAAQSLCTATAFYCSKEHLAAARDGTPGFALSLDEGMRLGRAIFEPSLAGLATK